MNREVNLCRDTNFVSRYYALVDRYASETERASSLLVFVDHFRTAGFKVSKDGVENFIRIREQNDAEWGMNVSCSGERLELILVAPDGGFTFHGLAYSGAKEVCPDLVRSPRYPKVPLPRESELEDLAREVHSLYVDLKRAGGP